MIELSLLGVPELRHSGESSEAVLVQPRRLALLAYLAASKGAFQRRDRLLLLFWGEQPESRARARLRQALYIIRQSLGDDVFTSRGDEEVGINPAAISVDVVELERALADGNPERALELYRGDFLADFNIDDASEFERWATERRRDLRRSMVGAAFQLSDGALGSGSREASTRWARHAVDLADYAEDHVRHAMRNIAATGDRSAALEVYETLCERLRTDLEVEPEIETTSLANDIRANVGVGALAEIVITEAPRSDTVAGDGVTSGDTIGMMSRIRDRVRMGAAVAGIVVAATLVGAFVLHANRASAFRDASAADRVAVFPFTVRSRPGEVGYLREGAATLLGLALDGAGRLRSVDANAVLSASPASVDLDAAQHLAATLGAGQFVLGEIDAAGARISIAATLYDARGRTQSRATAVGDENHVFELVDSLARVLAVSAMADSSARLAGAASTSTRSLVAFKAFLVGETNVRSGHYHEAVAAFQAAIEADSGFGLAYYRMSIPREWTVGESSGDSAAAMAEHFSATLPARDRKLLAARRAFVRRDRVESERLVREVLAYYPADADAWSQLGEIAFHLGPNEGRSVDEAREAFLTVLRYRPNDLSAHVHLTRIAARMGDSGHLDEWSEPNVALGGPSKIGNFELAAMRAVVLGDKAAHDAVISTANKATELTVLATAWRTALYAGDPDAALEIIAPRGVNSLYARELEVVERIAGGHMALTGVPTDTAARVHAALIGLVVALPSAPDMPALARQSHEALRRALAQRNPPSATLIMTARILNARYPDSLPAFSNLPALSAEREQSIVAITTAMRLLATDPARALDAVSPARLDEMPWRNDPRYDVVASVRAEALHHLGRDAEAIAWLESIGMNSAGTSVPIPIATRRIAEFEDARGAHGVAARERSRFVRMWRSCDPELRPFVDAARNPK